MNHLTFRVNPELKPNNSTGGSPYVVGVPESWGGVTGRETAR